METSHYNGKSSEMIEVEIYETGEKTRIAAKNQITNKKNRLDKSIIITASEYASYKADISNYVM